MVMKFSLAAARRNRGLTQGQVADRIGVSRTTVVNWEKGSTRISYAALTRLSNLYGIPLENLRVPANNFFH